MFQSFELMADKAASAERVAALRNAMATAGVGGFLVPRADAHMGENVAPRDQRLAWLTGFTGSAGIAVVLADRAAIFVDGRYTLQAANQVDGAVFEIVPVHETPVASWLAEALAADARLGYDPWLHGAAEIERLRAAAEEADAELVSLGNLVDTIWEDQPPAPLAAARIHPPGLAGEDAGSKRRRLGQAIAAQEARSAILTLPDSIAWLLNIRGGDIARTPVLHGFAVLHADGRVDLVAEPDKFSGDVRAHLGNEVTIHAPDALSGLVAELEGPVLLDRTSCPLWFAEQLDAVGTERMSGQDPCIQPKARKTEAELAGMRAAHLRDGAAMATFLCWLDGALAAGESLTEIAIVEKLEAFRAAGGDLEDISFETICGSGPHGAIVHYRVTRDTDRRLVPGDLLLVDSGAQYPDGTTDITRTMATGPVTAEQRRHFTLVLKGMIAVSVARWPVGLAGRDLDPLARRALWAAGLDYDHGTGHGVGACLGVHEGPQSLSRRGTVPLEPGMILSNEPGFYQEGAYGIRIENLVIVTGAEVPAGGTRAMLGFETMTWCPIDRRLIDASLLDVTELAWLDAYHAEVLARIGPMVTPEVRDWMVAACAPLGLADRVIGQARTAEEGTAMSSKITIEPHAGAVSIRAGGAVIAETTSALVLHEDGHAPVYYLPHEDAGVEFLDRSDLVTHCPLKGDATHYHLVTKSGTIENAAWSYESPIADVAEIAGYVAFYGDKVTVSTG